MTYSHHKTIKKIGQLCLERSLLNNEELESALYHARLFNMRVGEAAVELGYLSKEDIAHILSAQTQIPFIELRQITLNHDALRVLPLKFCMKNKIICYKAEHDKLFIALHDPLNTKLLDDIMSLTKKQLIKAVCTENALDYVFHTYFTPTEREESYATNIQKRSHNGLEYIVMDARKHMATEVHIDAITNTLRIRYRMHGVLHPISCSAALYEACQQLIQNPPHEQQHIVLHVDGKKEDIWVSLTHIPHTSCMILTLQFSGHMAAHDLDTLGLSDEVYKTYTDALAHETGIILVTSPPQQGLSTVLYHSMSHAHTMNKKMLVLYRDDVYPMTYIPYISLQKTNLAHLFAKVPYHDIIMVDADTHDFPILREALHHPLHYRLLLCGISQHHPYVLFSQLSHIGGISQMIRGILFQRLIRILCDQCKNKRPLTFFELQGLKQHSHLTDHITDTYEAPGCPACHHAGFTSQKGLFAYMPFDMDSGTLFGAHKNHDTQWRLLAKHILHTLQEQALLHVKQGATSLSETLHLFRP